MTDDPTLLDLLLALARTEPGTVRDVHENEHEIAPYLEEWQAAGYPGVPQGDPIPEGYDGLCHIEVLPRWRIGRGRYWRPHGNGYTDRKTDAGLFTVDEARARAARFERIRLVRAE